MKKLIIVVFAISFYIVSYAQEMRSVKGSHIPNPVCHASHEVHKSFVPPPADFLLKSSDKKSEIILRLKGFPEEAQVAMEYAAAIWESIIESEIPIHISAEWSSSLGSNTLASCGPETYYIDFKNAPFKNRYYPVAIAEKISGEELNGESRNDIEARFSSKIDWYYGTDGETDEDKYDFVSVALHEIAHGLGFTGFFFVDDDAGAYAYYEFGDATTFDMLVENLQGEQLIDTSFFENASNDLKRQLESRLMYANSPVARSVSNDYRPRLYAPSPFDDGSSVYHLNDATYPHGDENSLMTHAVGKGEAIHDPGPLTSGILEDIGWTNLLIMHDQVKDKEQVEPLVFTTTIDSYYPVADSVVYVYYSSNDFLSTDTLFLLPTQNENEYSAILNLQTGADDLQYFVEVMDTKGRVRTKPWNAPKAVYDIHFGVDNEAPVISSTTIDYFLLKGDPLQVVAHVDDNLGIDSVFVSYAINGIEQIPFGITLDYGIRYTGFFPFDLETLKDGDIVTYTIIATDASSAKNTTTYPDAEVLEFKVEEIFEPVTHYTNNFNQTTPDFIISDFDIYTADNFNDGALHSPHPYESTNQDNKDLNFSTFLKYPIILQEDGDMTFDEVVLVEPGDLLADYGDDNFWDYVIIEGSRDFGETWLEITDGYDAGYNYTWEQNYNADIVGQDSETEGSAEWFVTRNIDLLRSGNFNAGDTILVRFRLYSDPYARGWGWVIDNLRIQNPVSTSLTKLSPGQINVFPNPFQQQFNIEIELESDIKEVQIDIFDSFGRNIFSSFYPKINRVNETINLQEYTSGLYLLKISENGIPVLSKKLIKR